MIYTCRSQGNTQRWRILTPGKQLSGEVFFLRGERLGTTYTISGPGGYPYNITLISTQQYNFTSTLSIVATQSLENTNLACIATTETRATIKIRGLYS